MSPRSIANRLRDIVAAIDAIAESERRLEAAGIGREERVRVSSAVREVAIIGEAVSVLDEELTSREPSIPWSDIARIRILLDHHYHRVDTDILWATIDADLEPLRAAVGRLLDSLA